jgi:hypothetical protein
LSFFWSRDKEIKKNGWFEMMSIGQGCKIIFLKKWGIVLFINILSRQIGLRSGRTAERKNKKKEEKKKKKKKKKKNLDPKMSSASQKKKKKKKKKKKTRTNIAT